MDMSLYPSKAVTYGISVLISLFLVAYPNLTVLSLLFTFMLSPSLSFQRQNNLATSFATFSHANPSFSEFLLPQENLQDIFLNKENNTLEEVMELAFKMIIYFLSSPKLKQ